MATKGLWNIGGLNLPDLGLTEALNKALGGNALPSTWLNAGVLNPKPAFAYDSSISIPKGTTKSTPVSQLGFTPSTPAKRSFGVTGTWEPAPSANQGTGGAAPQRSYSFGTPDNPDLSNPVKQTDYNNYINEQQQADRDRIRAEEERALQAAIGSFEARKQGLMNRIPGLQENLKLTQAGYDENLAKFLAESGRAQTQKLGELDEARTATEEEYGIAARKTRATAKSLARKLKNMFAGRGSLDSTQYQDMNVEQSKEIAQSMGDMNRELAGKVTAIGKEGEDIKQYYTEQNRAEQQRVQLAKEQAKADTDQLIQGIMDDTNLTDAQKVEAVVQAENRLSQRLSQLDSKEAELAESRRQSDRDYALKVAQLQQKGTSSSYTNTMNQNKAISSALTTLTALKDKLGVNPSPQIVQQVFRDYGIRDDVASQYANFFGAPNQEQDEVLGLLG